MTLSFLIPFAVSGILALVAPWAGRRLPPRPAAWLLAAASLVAAGGCATALALLAFTLIGRIPLIAAEGHWSPGRLAADSPVTPYVAAICAVLLAFCLLNGTVTACRQLGVLRATRREGRGLPLAGDLSVIDDAVPIAFALPGSPGRIVVSSGMLRALTTDEHRALLAHERAHLRHRHHVFLLLLQVTAAVNPFLRRVATAGGYALERWADEEAAAVVADRRLVARAVARAALATRNAPAPGLAVTGGPVPQRVQALLALPPAPSRGLVAAHALLMAACCLSLALSAHDIDRVLDAASPLHTAVATHRR